MEIRFKDKDGTYYGLKCSSGELATDVLRRSNIPVSSVIATRNGVMVPPSLLTLRDGDEILIEMVENFVLRDIAEIPVEVYRAQNPVYVKEFLEFRDGSIVKRSVQFNEESFIEYVSKKFEENISGHKLLEEGDGVVVGFSGGSDSTVLLHLLAKYRSEHPGFEITAATLTDLYDVNTGFASDFARKNGIRQELVGPKQVMELFHLKVPFVKALDTLLAGPYKSQALFIGHHVIRRSVEIVAERIGFNKITLGLEEEEFPTSLLGTYTTGLFVTGIHTRASPKFTYIFPHYNISKKEVMTYLKLVIKDYKKMPPYAPFTLGAFSPIRSLYFATYANMLEVWPGIQNHLYEGYERILPTVRHEIRFKQCKNCLGYYLDQAKVDLAMCDACKAFNDSGLLLPEVTA